MTYLSWREQDLLCYALSPHSQARARAGVRGGVYEVTVTPDEHGRSVFTSPWGKTYAYAQLPPDRLEVHDETPPGHVTVTVYF